jgi:hypothetical protein
MMYFYRINPPENFSPPTPNSMLVNETFEIEMQETTLNYLNKGQGATNFMKERLNVNIGVRKVRCPHNLCHDCS